MTFWTPTQQGVTKDPKRQFKWLATIGSIPTYVLKKVDKPSFAISETEHKFLNHTYYYPGRVTWNTITMTIVDVVNPDMAKTVAEIVYNSGYRPLSEAPGVGQPSASTMCKSNAVAALGSFEIAQIDCDGNEVEAWTLNNAWVQDVKFGSLDYSSEELLDTDLTIRYDWASLRTANIAAPNDAFGAGPNPIWGSNGS
jgi:hypothetical protein